MEIKNVISALSALAQEARLAVFRLLVEAGPAGLPAGEVGKKLSIPAATLSFHLAQLQHAGLVVARRQGRQLIQAADFSQMSTLIAYLTENCCSGDVGACFPGRVVKCAPKSLRPRLRKRKA